MPMWSTSITRGPGSTPHPLAGILRRYDLTTGSKTDILHVQQASIVPHCLPVSASLPCRRKGLSSILVQSATGGPAKAMYQTSSYVIDALRVASSTTLLFVIDNTGTGRIDTSHNGLWKVNTDGTGLARLTSNTSSRMNSLLIGSMNGGKHGAFASLPGNTGTVDTLDIVGWTMMG